MVLSPLTAPPAVAADAAQFDPGEIISDAIFYDGSGTSMEQIQDILDSEGSSCRATSTLDCLKDVRVTITAQASDLYCSSIPGASGVRAAEVFAVVGAACGINPAVLVVLVEKEQSLVSRSTPSSYAYRYATGFNCPDTAPCSDATSGFFLQVYYAARQFEVYRLNPNSFRHRAGATIPIAYHPNSACGARSVKIANDATAGLYNYTPYTPNSAALANLYGTGDSCSSYGNRNFWRIYSDWFGLGNLTAAGSFEQSTSGWRFGSGVDRSIVGPVDDAPDGSYYLAANASAQGQSLYQRLDVSPRQGETFTATLWVRSGVEGESFSGKAALWALGGRTEVATSSFTAEGEWTRVDLNLPISRTGHTSMKLQIYFGSQGLHLDLDAVEVVRTPWQPRRDEISVDSPGFEQGLSTWTFKNGFMDRAVYTIPELAREGDRFLASNTKVRGRSVGVDLRSVVPVAGETYTAVFWMRSGSASRPFDAKVAIWALGGSNEVATTRVQVGGEWTQVQVTLPVQKAGHNRLRLEVYLISTRYDLRIDDVSVVATVLPDGSFPSGSDAWIASPGASFSIAEEGWGSEGREAFDGGSAGVVTFAEGGQAIRTTVDRSVRAGDSYTATVWMRTSDPEQEFTGRLALWGLGGGNEVATTDVTVTGEWAPYEVTLEAGVDHSQLRVQLYSGSTAGGVELVMDGVTLR